MNDTPPTSHISPPPNHHADHPGFSGVSGLVAAVSFLYGRDAAAEIAIDVAALQPGERLVDVGCGPGVAAARAARLGAQVVGVDPATVMLTLARRRWRRLRVDWRLGTAESIPVEGGVDVVWSLSTVHHWADVDAGLAEVRRVLRPGGRLVVTEREIADWRAAGTPGHGWVRAQADAFAERCGEVGFDGLEVTDRPGNGTGRVLAVRAVRR
jgi:SAM-dependent methyltransferase